MIIPDARLLNTLIIFLISALVLACLRVAGYDLVLLSGLWAIAFSALVVLLIVDLLVSRDYTKVELTRQISSSFALGAETRIGLKFENPLSNQLLVRFVDGYPPEVVPAHFPLEVVLEPGQETTLEYSVRPIKRGEASFTYAQLRIRSAFRFWRISTKRGEPQSVKIYPNFMAVSNLNFLVYEQQLNHIGAHALQRRGLGLDFKQLREYQFGDEIRQVDWKASSRQHKLISREYQDERDQDVIFLLDTGRRMRARDSELSHFDHCLNAMLLTSYIALMAGDAVGFMSFAGTNRWVSPVKGKSSINRLLNGLYDLHSTSDASDLPKAAENLMLRHQKRSLVVVVTNIRGEDSDDLVQAIKLLSRKHLVLVACLREKVLDQQDIDPASSIDDALRLAGINLYKDQRARLIKLLRTQGVVVTDATADTMHVALINEYMILKRAGRI